MKRPRNFDPFAPVYDDGPTAEGGVELRRIEPLRCERCGRPFIQTVCEHCWEAVRPKLDAVHLGSLRSQLGSEICIDEICMETPDPVNVMRQKLADLGGVPVGNVQFQGSHQEGNMIIGDFVVSKRTT